MDRRESKLASLHLADSGFLFDPYTGLTYGLNETGAAIEGTITVRTTVGGQPTEVAVGTVDMMFSHIDNNISGMKFPEFNFVFNSQFMELFETYRRELEVKLPQ